MMIKKTYLAAAALVFLQLFSGCQKEQPVPVKIQLLAKAPWKMVEWKSDPAYPIQTPGGIVYFADFFEYYKAVDLPCILQRNLGFDVGTSDYNYEYGAYTSRQGVGNCSTDPIQKKGVWFLHETQNESSLYLQKDITVPVLDFIYTIEEITESRLVLSYKVVNGGFPYIFRQTYTHD
jgi:hypothetical protein